MHGWVATVCDGAVGGSAAPACVGKCFGAVRRSGGGGTKDEALRHEKMGKEGKEGGGTSGAGVNRASIEPKAVVDTLIRGWPESTTAPQLASCALRARCRRRRTAAAQRRKRSGGAVFTGCRRPQSVASASEEGEKARSRVFEMRVPQATGRMSRSVSCGAHGWRQFAG